MIVVTLVTKHTTGKRMLFHQREVTLVLVVRVIRLLCTCYPLPLAVTLQHGKVEQSHGVVLLHRSMPHRT